MSKRIVDTGAAKANAKLNIRKGRKPLSDAEKSPAGRFDRLAGVRAAKVRKLCIGISRAFNRDYCEWTDEQMELLLKHLRNSIKRVEQAAQSPTSAAKRANGAYQRVPSIFASGE